MTIYDISEVEPRIYLKETNSHPYHALLSSPEEVLNFMKDYMADLTTECILVFNLDYCGNVLNFSKVGIGTANMVVSTGREIFKTAVLSNASSVLLCHNHTSHGNPSPSKEDYRFTHTMVKSGQILGIPVIDHVIVTPEKHFYSFLCNEPTLFQNTDTSVTAAEY